MAAVTDADKLRKMISEAKRGGWSDWLGLALTLRAVAEPLADVVSTAGKHPRSYRVHDAVDALLSALSAALKEQQP